MKLDARAEAKALVATAGMSAFIPEGRAYVAGPSDDQLLTVPLDAIQAFVRGPGVANFVDQRAFSILEVIRLGTSLPPIEVHALGTGQPYCYKLHNGFHRFHLSCALGFSEIPVIVVPLPY